MNQVAPDSPTHAPNLTLRWLLLVVFIIVTIVNFGAPLLPGGQEQFRGMPDTRVDAAAYAFPIIWSIIFAGMIGFAISLIRRPSETSPSLNAAIVALLVAGVASILFAPISLYGNSVASWFDIVAHLLALVVAQLFLRRHASQTELANHSQHRRWWYAPSMYLGWICAATVISSALALREIGVRVDPELAEIVTLMTIACLTIVGAVMVERRDCVLTLTVAWAFVAIGVEQAAFPMIRKTAWGAAAILIVMSATAFYLQRFFYAWELPQSKNESK